MGSIRSLHVVGLRPTAEQRSDGPDAAYERVPHALSGAQHDRPQHDFAPPGFTASTVADATWSSTPAPGNQSRMNSTLAAPDAHPVNAAMSFSSLSGRAFIFTAFEMARRARHEDEEDVALGARRHGERCPTRSARQHARHGRARGVPAQTVRRRGERSRSRPGREASVAPTSTVRTTGGALSRKVRYRSRVPSTPCANRRHAIAQPRDAHS